MNELIKEGFCFVNQLNRDGKNYVALRNIRNPKETLILTIENGEVIQEEYPANLKDAWEKLWR